MKRLILSIAIIAGVVCTQKSVHASVTDKITFVKEDDGLDNMRSDILTEINAYRAKKGKPALVLNEDANAEADKHSKNMAKGSVAFGHIGFSDRAGRLMKKISGINESAENVAYGYMTAEEVVAGWIKSPGHRKNIEGNFNLTGIGVAKAKNGDIYYTQIFLNKH